MLCHRDLITTAAFHSFRDEKTARFYSFARNKKDAEIAEQNTTPKETIKEKPKEKSPQNEKSIESPFAKAALTAA